MKFSIVFCHWKTGKMSAYTVAQILKHKGNHDIEILICDNNSGDGSIEYLAPFKDKTTVFDYPKDKLQSHGIGYSLLFENASNEWIICMESDSFPTQDGWLDYYARLINEGYDSAGSLLKLSGGTYQHPAGSLYRRSIFIDAWLYCKQLPYYYFPNFAMSDGFACHTMVHKSIVNDVLANPEDWVELADGYKPYDPQLAEQKATHYSPVVAPFHNGMGGLDESIKTYGNRSPETEARAILCEHGKRIIKRMGYEPGQWMHYWQLAMGKKIFYIPTETKWMHDKENQQQQYTKTENGVLHLWGISAYHDYDGGDKEITGVKRLAPEELYNSLPINQRID
jgi:glycosyltransferase involved in cell wall biosynthesis